MPTLLMRLAGPMQSWGTQSRFRERDTGHEPSKSGVIGLICAALGRSREEPVDDLVGLRMGVRVDREGDIRVDYQTAGGTHLQGDNYGIVGPGGSGRVTLPSPRYYLADASFLVGIESDDRAQLETINSALAAPHWQLCLGRKAFVPGWPIHLPDDGPLGPGVRDGALDTELTEYPWLDEGRRRKTRSPDQVRLVTDVLSGTTTEVRRDVPLSFAERRFTVRYVETRWIRVPEEVICISPSSR